LAEVIFIVLLARLSKVGNQDAFKKKLILIIKTIQTLLFLQNNVQQFLIVSSVGADAMRV
jgi:hypothetical protein